ncbi:MAG: DUF721 domain-containing protein [Prochlorothrix sp.]|nr:DUF721 domain-containing protein [Prochlorothrix sp.]
MRRNSFQTLESILGRLSQRSSWQAPQQFQQIVQLWPTIVGSPVAAQTRPVRLDRQMLQVATATPVWAQHLQFERHHILTKLNTQLGLDLRDIRFSTALWSTSPYPDRQQLASVEQQILWQQHPSRVPSPASNAPPIPPPNPTPNSSSAKSPQDPTPPPLVYCPQCQCPSPPGELQRWSVCAFCAAKAWSTQTHQDSRPPQEPS